MRGRWSDPLSNPLILYIGWHPCPGSTDDPGGLEVEGWPPEDHDVFLPGRRVCYVRKDPWWEQRPISLGCFGTVIENDTGWLLASNNEPPRLPHCYRIEWDATCDELHRRWVYTAMRGELEAV